MLLSGGRLVAKTPILNFTPATSSDWWYNSERVSRLGAYSDMYRVHLWVNTLVSKRAGATARLPFKVYEKDDLNRPEADGHPYQVLMSNPNPAVSPFRFWEWVSSSFDVYGETFLLKRRDGGGRPFQLVPLNPTGMTIQDDGGWDFDNGRAQIKGIDPADLVHFKSYNPCDGRRGLSKLEPLRATLENEAAARTATSSFWRNGARPGVALRHPRTLGPEAGARLKQQWNDIAQGTGKTGSTVILEEGMEAQVMTLSAEEAQYIETRKLNREECCAVYDVPPPVVHILDRATFSNITEQMRSMYRDTMAPPLNALESDLDSQLREPDFGPGVYGEFLLDQVLRGDFEARAAAYQQADWMTIAEKRQKENLPYIEGTDKIFVNAAIVPLDQAARTRVPVAVQATAAADPPDDDDDEDDGDPPAKSLPAGVARSVMGRLSWQQNLDQVVADDLVKGLNGDTPTVLDALAAALKDGDDVPALRARIRALTTKGTGR